MRDDKDWDPKRMIEVTESFGRMSPTLKATLSEMKPKENSDQRKSRLRREARAIREAAAEKNAKAKPVKTKAKTIANSDKPRKTAATKSKAIGKQTPTKPRRARKPVSAA
jgi:hypothetical protein